MRRSQRAVDEREMHLAVEGIAATSNAVIEQHEQNATDPKQKKFRKSAQAVILRSIPRLILARLERYWSFRSFLWRALAPSVAERLFCLSMKFLQLICLLLLGFVAERNSVRAAEVPKVEMVRIPGGAFVMGAKDEPDALPHDISVSPFMMDKFLVTQELFQQVLGSNPSRWKGAKNPVEQVRWSDAARFCNKRSELEGLQPCYDLKTWECNFDANGYRLPTEAEWEYACRAGTTTDYFFGESPGKLSEYAWFEKNSGGKPRPVGQKKPNPWGLADICGNVWEWCNDFYSVDYYKESPKQDPKGPATGQTKVLRGGAWRFSADNCRSGYRYNENPGYADVCFGYDIYGFRCVRKP